MCKKQLPDSQYYLIGVFYSMVMRLKKIKSSSVSNYLASLFAMFVAEAPFW